MREFNIAGQHSSTVKLHGNSHFTLGRARPAQQRGEKRQRDRTGPTEPHIVGNRQTEGVTARPARIAPHQPGPLASFHTSQSNPVPLDAQMLDQQAGSCQHAQFDWRRDGPDCVPLLDTNGVRRFRRDSHIDQDRGDLRLRLRDSDYECRACPPPKRHDQSLYVDDVARFAIMKP